MAGEYINLHLNQDLIIDAIKNYIEGNFKNYHFDENGFEIIGGTQRKYKFYVDDVEYILDLYFKKGGITSIRPDSGKLNTRELKHKIAEYIVKETSLNCGANSSFSVVIGKTSIIEEIIEFIKLSEIVINVDEPDVRDVLTIHKIYGPHGDELTLNHYTTTNRLRIQGKPMFLFGEALAIVTEFLPHEQDVDTISITNKVPTTLIVNNNRLKAVLPNAYEHIHEVTKKLLSTSYSLTDIFTEQETYDFIATPALKAIESHMKHILPEYKMSCDSQGRFIMFEECPNTKNKILKSSYKVNIAHKKRDEICDILVKTYTFFAKNRHGLSHAHNNVDRTRIITDRTVADEIVKTSILLIDEYYGIL